MDGILIDTTTGDLLIEKGGLVIGNADGQIAEAVLMAMRGEWKEQPLLGAEAAKMVGGEPDVMWGQETKQMLKACGLKVEKVTLSNNAVITVE